MEPIFRASYYDFLKFAKIAFVVVTFIASSLKIIKILYLISVKRRAIGKKVFWAKKKNRPSFLVISHANEFR